MLITQVTISYLPIWSSRAAKGIPGDTDLEKESGKRCLVSKKLDLIHRSTAHHCTGAERIRD